MSKRSSWGATQEAYVNSPLAKERSRHAETVGVLHRVCGLLRLESSVEQLSKWCDEEERRRRDERKAVG